MINDLSNLLKGSALQKRFCIAIHLEEQKVTGLKKNGLGSLFLLAASATAVLGRNIVTDDYFVGRSLPAVIASIAEMIILFAAMACACTMFRMLFRTAESSVPRMPVL